MIDVDGWQKVQSDDKETFATFENSEATLYIRRGEAWPDEIDVVLKDGEDRHIIAQHEIMPEAVHAAESFMASVPM